ncbi:MAG: hypothetical protein PHE24_05985 [Patescibacteria group bacterium]|nr:hypothetical protein [Patescibacteria group bacterium]
MDKNFIDFSLPPKKKGVFSWKKLPLGFKFFLIIVFEIIYLLVNWKISGKIDFKEMTPADLGVFIFIAIIGGLILAFCDNFAEALSFLFNQPSNNPWVKAFYVFAAVSFALAILLILAILVFYQEIFYGDIFYYFIK